MTIRALLIMLLLPAIAQAAPQRIVSLNPCLDAILVEVADKAQIRAISHFSHNPDSSSMPQATARQFDVNYGSAEDVLVQAPDLVLASSYTPAATRQALARLGIKLMLFDVPKSSAESIAHIRAIAKATGNVPRGEAVVSRIKASFSGPTPPVRPALIRSDSGFILGNGTVMDELLAHSGFTNISTSLGMQMSDTLPLEGLLLNPPQLLFRLSSSEVPRHAVMQKLSQRITVRNMPQQLVNCAGPTMIDALAFLRAERARLP
jgi:iron complex transport system substrate-binding protein